jgi:hypothetical protein
MLILGSRSGEDGDESDLLCRTEVRRLVERSIGDTLSAASCPDPIVTANLQRGPGCENSRLAMRRIYRGEVHAMGNCRAFSRLRDCLPRATGIPLHTSGRLNAGSGW